MQRESQSARNLALKRGSVSAISASAISAKREFASALLGGAPQ